MGSTNPSTFTDTMSGDTLADLRETAGSLMSSVIDFVAAESNGNTDPALDLMRRAKILEATRRIQLLTKDPGDEWTDMVYASTLMTAKRLFCDWGVFDAIPTEGTISFAELAAKVDAEEMLLVRVAGILISTGYLKQIGTNQVAHTRFSLVFANNDRRGLLFNTGWDNCVVPYATMPKYFELYGRKEPRTTTHTPNGFAHGKPDLAIYDLIQSDPIRLARWIPAMAAVEERMPIAGIYDFSWLVSWAQAEAAQHQQHGAGTPAPDRPLLVDVGGGRGQAIKAITKEFPGIPVHRCVLQERPEVIDAVLAADEPELRLVTKMPINFHEGQPLKGALVYWIRRCLHNYPDDTAINVLRHIADAAAPDSRVLIFEDVLDSPPHYMAAIMDFMMMGMGGKQRTRARWDEMLAEVGLKITDVQRGKGPWKTQCVMECVKI